jgi:hypothetical protein
MLIAAQRSIAKLPQTLGMISSSYWTHLQEGQMLDRQELNVYEGRDLLGKIGLFFSNTHAQGLLHKRGC